MNDVYPVLLTFREQIKLFHFQTSSYGHHKACDKFIENFDNLIDKFMEEYQGKEGTRVHLKIRNFALKNIKDVRTIISLSKGMKAYLKQLDLDFDLANLRDEMVGAVHQFQYLLTFF